MPETPLQQARERLFQEREGAERRQAKEVQADIAEIQKIRDELEVLASRLQEMCDKLRTRVRRSPTESSSSVVMYTNANLRMAGVVLQVSRRTASLDKVLKIGEAEKREQERIAAQRQRREDKARQEAENQRRMLELQGSDNDFEELFGSFEDDDDQEGVTNA